MTTNTEGSAPEQKAPAKEVVGGTATIPQLSDMNHKLDLLLAALGVNEEEKNDDTNG